MFPDPADAPTKRLEPFRLGDIPSEILDQLTRPEFVSSPACSLDRLLISYREGRRKVLVSPEDKAGFLQALVARCTHLVLDGDRATRPQSASRV